MRFWSACSPREKVWLVLSWVALMAQSVSGMARGAEGQSDLSVFYRTCRLLGDGGGAEVYAARDALAGWYRCIPPAGLLWFAPFALGSSRAASFGWGLFNLGLVGVGVWALLAILRDWPRDPELARRLAPWAVGALLWLAAPCLQTGQYSVLFVIAWLLALRWALRGRHDGAMVLLALPAAIKVYPALLLAAFLGASPTKRWPRSLAVFALAFAFWTWIAPLPFYGARTPALVSSFYRNAVFSSSGRLSESQSTGQTSAHGLDIIALRFFSRDAQPLPGAPPHLDLAPQSVLSAVNVLRVLLLGATIAFWARRRGERKTSDDWIASLALWSALLFLMVPGAKSRYAVYTLPAFLPLLGLAAALWRGQAPTRWRYTLFVLIVGALVLSLLPGGKSLPADPRLWGAGLWGTFVLWLENVRLLLKGPVASSPSSRDVPASGAPQRVSSSSTG